MKFEDVGSHVQKGDETVARDQGAARAISVSLAYFLAHIPTDLPVLFILLSISCHCSPSSTPG